MDQVTYNELRRVLALDPSNMTWDEKLFLTARRDYLTSEQRRIFAPVIAEVKQETEKKIGAEVSLDFSSATPLRLVDPALATEPALPSQYPAPGTEVGDPLPNPQETIEEQEAHLAENPIMTVLVDTEPDVVPVPETPIVPEQPTQPMQPEPTPEAPAEPMPTPVEAEQPAVVTPDVVSEPVVEETAAPVVTEPVVAEPMPAPVADTDVDHSADPDWTGE